MSPIQPPDQVPPVQAPVPQAPVPQAPVPQAPVLQAPFAQAPVAQPPVAPAPAARAPWYTIVVALLILAAFAALCRYLLVEGVPLDPKTQQHQWDRMLIIFNAIQTMAAAAAGALLGTTVQQARVVSAEQRAQANEGEARKAEAARRQIGNLQPPGAAGDAAQEKLRAVTAALR